MMNQAEPAKVDSMYDHSFDVTWRYVVPPENDTRVVITQRQDGPFRKDITGGQGNYYVSGEGMFRGRWQHIEGSTRMTCNSLTEAEKSAEELWEIYKRNR